MSDGISDNLPAETIDRLLHRHPLDRATASLPLHTRERRARTQREAGGSTSQLGLDNMSAIVVRYNGARRRSVLPPALQLDETTLVTLSGTYGGPESNTSGQFGLICLAGQEHGATVVPGFVHSFLQSEQNPDLPDRINSAFLNALPGRDQARFGVLASDAHGDAELFSSGGVDIPQFGGRIVERNVPLARESAFQKFVYAPRLWAPSVAGVALFLLVTTAFATGTVRPAPPPAATQAPGEPTPTPDTRPALSFGGFVLIPPALGATPTPAEPLRLEVQVTADTTAPAPVVPAPSPAALSQSEAGPPPGSRLDYALKIASVANDQFNRSLEEPIPTPGGR
jgi:hypothetical protein